MNVIKNVTAFWSAFVSVLLKCVAGLGFATPARTARATAQVPAAAPAATPAAAPVRGTVSGTAAPAEPIPTRTPGCAAYLPAPRPGGRTLPPTMKQRIRAEAHGSSPSARSIGAGLDVSDTPPYTANTALADHALTAADENARRAHENAALVR
ncbi:DUF6344 domain-containing protein [Actinacidiphila alni]|uniref:DUF6344 domain-containing protein n=1 Tax=Actinacidiphila alni TaxID=380248 RepID=UPI00340C3AA0